MLILIAESKTMTACNCRVDARDFECHRPAGYDEAFDIMARIASMSPREVAERAGLSLSMALKSHRMALDFPDKSLGEQAIRAFTGVVFKAIDFATLSEADRMELSRNVRIISSLYGWLRPDDTIKPYRLDYTSRIAPDDRAMSAYWREPLTASLVEELQTSGCKTILNLLPGDAEKCIDWTRVKPHADVWKVDFKQLKDGGTFVTPNANRLKTLRGHLLREIITRRLQSPADLQTLKTADLLPMPATSNHLTFCV